VTEEWRAIPGYEGYEVSDLGRVRSLDRWIDQANGSRRLFKGQTLRTRPFPRTGHRMVSLKRNSVGETFCVHRLVMLVFVGPRPDGMQICHNNGDSFDNRLVNLRYDTASGNVRDSVAHGTQRNTRKTHCKQGHEFSPENTYVVPTSAGVSRKCRTCRRASTRAWIDRQRDAAAQVAS
jgi:hypothetical protein